MADSAYGQHDAALYTVYNDARDIPSFDWLSPIYVAPAITEQLNCGGAYGAGRSLL